jgi:GH24 family phage-related lysozyme (muramidase)
MTPTLHSREAELFVSAWEGLKLVAYDPGDGVWTIGCGHTYGVCRGLTCTVEQAMMWLHDDMADRAQGLLQHMRRDPKQHQLDALTSLAFNLRNGVQQLAKSRTLELFNLGDDIGCAEMILKWDMVNGRHSSPSYFPGIQKRRRAERAMYLHGDYSGRP